MPLAEILAHVDRLTYGIVTEDVVADLYTEVVTQLAQDGRLWFAHFTTTASSVDEEIHIVPTDLVRILAVFYDDRQLSPETVLSMEALDPTWRTQRHTPVAYLTEHVQDREIRLWPPGDHQCEELGWLYTRTPPATPRFLDFPIAMLIVARELSRESAHRDLAASAEWQRLGEQLLGMVAS